MLRIKYRVVRDPEDYSECHTIIEDVEVNTSYLEDLLDKIVLTHYDPEPGGHTDSGLVYSHSEATATYYGYDKETGEHVVVWLREYWGWGMTSNAVEVCGDHGCHLVPACPTGSGRIEFTVEIEPTEDTPEEVGASEPLDEPRTLREKLVEWLSEEAEYYKNRDDTLYAAVAEHLEKLARLLQGTAPAAVKAH